MKNEKITVNISHEIYKNGDFHIYNSEFDNGEEISVKTSGFELLGGKSILVGEMGKYKGKKSFNARYEEINIKTKDTQERFLSSIVGDVKARNIMNVIDDINIFNTENYNNIPKVKGIASRRDEIFDLIKESLKEFQNLGIMNKLMIKFDGYMSDKKIKVLAKKLYDYSEMFETPYKIMVDDCEFGFKYADKICLSYLNIDEKNKERLNYLTSYLMKKALSNGNVYIDVDTFKDYLIRNNFNFTVNIDEFIFNNPLIKVENNICYPLDLYIAETEIPMLLQQIKEKFKKNIDISKHIESFEKQNGFKYDEKQIEAINTMVNENVSIITGGAGCGKTTILKAALTILKDNFERCKLCAPTGKAARRMSECTGEDASTIHSFIFPLIDNQGYCFENILVIDEFSMVDLKLFHKTLKVITKLSFTKLIIIGDPNQLPSVGNGNVLYDLIDSKSLPTIKLETTHRQKGNNDIIKVAHMAKNQKYFNFDIKSKTFFCQTNHSLTETEKFILRMYKYIKDKFDDYQDFVNEFQIITPTKGKKEGYSSTQSINEMIKNKFNPNYYYNAESKTKYPFGLNDKIMNTVNNRDKDVYNGEIGIVQNFSKFKFEVYFPSLERTETFLESEKDNFILAYACTVHKTQGSEYKYLLIVYDQMLPHLVDSRLLYTAITRGKNTVIMSSTSTLVNQAFAKNNIVKRYSKLNERMEKTFVK